jgi:hypothetical protein
LIQIRDDYEDGMIKYNVVSLIEDVGMERQMNVKMVKYK